MVSKNTLALVGCLVLIIIGLTLISRSPQGSQSLQGKISSVVLGNKEISVEVADTPALEERGLSSHIPLSDSEGMLFVFDKPDNYGFWMKDMLFPIDIIWIGPNLRITHIEKSLATSTYPTSFYPGAPSLYVLEISSGESDVLGVKIGDLMRFVRK